MYLLYLINKDYIRGVDNRFLNHDNFETEGNR